VDGQRLCVAGGGGRLSTAAPAADADAGQRLCARLAAADTTLHTERLRLEPLRAAHAAELFAGLSDERLYRWIPQDPPASLDALAWRYGMLESRLSPEGDEFWLNWALRRRDGGQCIGTVQATVRADGSAYLAYELNADVWGHGYASEACAEVLRCLATHFEVTRVGADVDTRNAASIRLLERLGFSRAGLKRDADFFKGATSDEFRYELTLDAGKPAPLST
jgi:[ribosomal protein S5]-alanine N-acetyltransferase